MLLYIYGMKQIYLNPVSRESKDKRKQPGEAHNSPSLLRKRYRYEYTDRAFVFAP